jgi:P-type conjugative transfer ATPase TrbB
LLRRKPVRAPRPASLRAQRELRLREKLERELGPDVRAALGDPTVVEVVLNADGELWVERLGKEIEPIGVRMERVQAETLIGTVAALLDREIHDERPILEVELPFDGSRFEGVMPPISRAPVFAIRRRAVRVFTLGEYVDAGTVSSKRAAQLCEAIERRHTILICGGTGSGKTTLANALIAEAVRAAGPAERFLILEDTLELRCDAPNHVQLRTSEFVDLERLVRATMRLRPDRIAVGEVRGREALALLKAWNTGHPGGVTTVHANSARAALSRLDQLVQEAGVPSQPQLIADAIDWIVSIARTPSGRRVTEMVRVRGWIPGSGFDLETFARDNSDEGDEK